MKLLELLAKQLKEWPEIDECSDPILFITQDSSGTIFSWNDNGELKFVDGQWYMQGTIPFDEVIFDGSETCSDCSSAIVREDQWQSEREKMNKPKWIRARGKKPNYETEYPQRMHVRHRDGSTTSGWTSQAFNWSYLDGAPDADIMAYCVLPMETKDQEIEDVIPKHMAFGYASKEEMVAQIGEECPFAQVASTAEKTNFGTITYKLEIDATEATQRIDSLVAKWGQIVSPLKWRDAIIHCQAIIEDCEREIERNVNLLDAEGLMMQKDSKKAMQYYQTDIDMSDWRNWQIGDRVCATKNFDDVDIGDELIITRLDHADEGQPIGMSAGSSSTSWPNMNWVKFVSRP